MYPRRRLIRAVFIAAAVALPLAGSLWASYWLTRQSVAVDVSRLAQANARRAANILDQGQQALAALAQQVRGDCGAGDVHALRQAGFTSLYYREAGLVSDGRLTCTSFETLEAAVDIPAEYRRRPALYRQGAFELWEPQPTLLGGRSLLVVHHLDRDRGSYVNLLLHLDQFAELVRYFGSIDSAVYLIDRIHPAPLQIAGSRLDRLDPTREQFGANEAGDLVAVAHAHPYPIATVARAPADEVMARWMAQAQPTALISVLLTAMALFAVRRWLPGRSSRVEELRHAIRSGQLEVHYQPVLDARDHSVVSAEALVRWRHPRRGLVLPDQFIELAERHRLIEPLTEAVLREARLALYELPEPLGIAINIAPRLLRNGRLTHLVNRVFGADADLRRLTLEITERELVEFADTPAMQSLQALAARHARISLDDFGTGFSGLTQLRFLHPQQIKIDRSFIRALGEESITAALVDAVVAMTETLGVDLVAEGVETEAQRSQLLLRGIHVQQGWLYAKAMPLSDLQRYIANREQPSAHRRSPVHSH